MDNTQPPRDDRHNAFFDQMIRFFAKAAIIVFLVSLGFKWVAPDFRQGVNDRLTKLAQEVGRDQTRIVLTGFLVGNPAVYWKLSEMQEQKYEYERAQENMELALGLLEMHGADQEVRRRYGARLEHLRELTRAPARPGR